MKVNHNITSKMRRVMRTRAKVRGTADRPRLSVFRSNETTYVQVIDDTVGKTIVSATGKEIKNAHELTKLAEAIEIAKLAASKAKKAGIAKFVFDRGAYKYHGRVKAIADTVREAGIEM
ncbi:50S ribosomal protein L18 [Candidatus Cerribacteria bacterium 'Amazon FNV 2010 28 9']|uniref:Large ribosomal subunit protein uL18 n=1 Tax=Candidatus Cerribacteria bacterium 'Amazon FNV 2010 28 9' TaxID=2081795 RepID=A0A317JN71_9BACT|nr:MAG: 50S ribosomal protein L18 [Candidatus Cerribacteria bacterium 'Amazon FNV 2010 28 9']